ncbi:hypothetical protein MVG78_09610 [Roseomonas gilardii subsp. gilardii]|uniref:hypothetical protein n=1 Tax=Roseomonas gilardii TaxID=257708 RepID=UPI001FFA5E3D|nr:hypothetical protein [Roseomonas gilardii]UPG70900.1 hypothetical protein MVG78_09610 [Roseomonas gilardii subsp. gilardii]
MEQIESAYESVSQRLLAQIDEQELEQCLRVFHKVELSLRGPANGPVDGPGGGPGGGMEA